MNIEYIWIKEDDKGLIKGLDFNLSSTHRYSFDSKKSLLSRAENNNDYTGFFGKAVNQVTGIVGENGTGKTTLIRYILSLAKGTALKKANGIVVFAHDGGLLVHNPNGYTIDLGESCIEIADLKKTVDKLTFVFHSSHFDPFTFSDDFTKDELAGQVNLSTYHLLAHDIQSRANIDAKNKEAHFSLVVDHHRRMELNRQVSLIRNYGRSDLLFNFPKYIVFEISDLDEFQLGKEFKTLKEQFNEVQTSLNELSSSKNIFLFRTFRAGIFNLANHLSGFALNIPSAVPPNQYLEVLLRPVLMKTEFSIEEVEALASDTAKSPDAFVNYVGRKLEDIVRVLLVFERLITIKNIGKSSLSFYRNLVDTKKADLDSLIDLVQDENQITTYIDFRFSHDSLKSTSFSSGEYTLLSLFSRLYWAKRLGKDKIGTSVVLLLDEAELGLHPQWQLRFFQVLLDFINTQFRGKKIQIILTSHSPFMITDLPKEVVIFLKRKDGKTVIDDIKSKETFGANIHRLFQESFFLDEGLIGKFALGKIDELIQDINGLKSISRDEYSKYLKRVNMIGEPFIRTKLSEMVSGKLKSDALNEEIRRREEELNQMKSRKENDSDKA